MSRLDLEHDVIAMAKELGLRGNPVEAVVRFCQQKIEVWMAESGAVGSIAELESLVSEKLQLVFEEFRSDDELSEAIQKYTSQGEGAFAAVKLHFDDSTFGTLIERRKVDGSAPDRYVAFIDCRREKASRRFFTRWHEVAHLLTLTRQVELPVQRSTHHPLERLMDEVAGRMGFFDPLFAPVMEKHQQGGRLSFTIVEGIRQEYSPEASFQATLFACQRRMSSPVVYLEAGMGYKVDEERRITSRQKSLFKADEPAPKLRVKTTVPNEAAMTEDLRIVPNMRVPESSVIHRVFSGAEGDEASGEENLNDWKFSSGGSLGDWDVWIEARRLADRVIAMVQPIDGATAQ